MGRPLSLFLLIILVHNRRRSRDGQEELSYCVEESHHHQNEHHIHEFYRLCHHTSSLSLTLSRHLVACQAYNYDVELRYMLQTIINFFANFHPVAATLIMSMLPVVERFALPVAIIGYHLPAWEALILVVAGNMVPIIIILTFAGKFHEWVSKNSHHFFAKAWIKTLAHAQKKFARYEKYELAGLMVFMAIPLPINGGFTGALIAFVLGLSLRKAWPYLFGGVTIAACLTVGIILGLVKIF